MNFGYPPLKGKHFNPSHAEIGKSQGSIIPNVLSNGLNKPVRDCLEIAHPLERVEKNRLLSEFQMNMNLLRDIQGIHAPLRIAMELKAFDNVGRLPFLPSSNLSKDVVLGRDDYIDFTDILNPPEVHETLQRPNIVMERKLGIL